MRNFAISVLSIALLTGVLVAQSDQQSLGDAARQQRTEKKSTPKRVITNDDLAAIHPKDEPTTAAMPSSTAKPDPGAKKSDSDAKQSAAKSDSKDKKTEAAAPSETKLEQKYRDDVRKQRSLVAKLEKEITDREHTVQVQSTNYYMDPGSRLRDPKAWAEQREKLNKDIAEKQEKLQEARTTLDRLLDEARRLGIPERALE